MKRALVAAALVGTAFGGYYVSNPDAHQQMRRMPSSTDYRLESTRETRETITAYEYYQQPEVDVTFDGEVIYVWED